MLDEKRLTIYVYYKIPSREHAKFFSRVQNLSHSIIKLYPHIKTHHQRRLETDIDNNETWMEIYHNILRYEIKSFSTQLSVLAEQNELPKERKCEVFMTI